ncbi:MAG TPA: hypothetical protein VG733_00665, partial [Chthoniobacteraceae bacterium]|nr:hypothetical protein [Chthoniobacteraceae bacterium]
MTSELKKVSAGGKWLWSICLFLAFAFLLLIFGLAGSIWHHIAPGDKDLDQKRADNRITKREALDKDNEQKLTTYAWVNKDKGIVQIPIDRAMQLVATELATKKAGPSAVKVEEH